MAMLGVASRVEIPAAFFDESPRGRQAVAKVFQTIKDERMCHGEDLDRIEATGWEHLVDRRLRSRMRHTSDEPCKDR